MFSQPSYRGTKGGARNRLKNSIVLFSPLTDGYFFVQRDLLCLILPVFWYFFIILGNTSSSFACIRSSSAASTAFRPQVESGSCCFSTYLFYFAVLLLQQKEFASANERNHICDDIKRGTRELGFPCSGECCSGVPATAPKVVCRRLLTISSLMSWSECVCLEEALIMMFWVKWFGNWSSCLIP